VKTYLLSTYKDPHCMKCNVAWNRELIDNALSKAFRTGELKKHRENTLLDREKSMLPATVPLVEVEMEKRKIQKEIQDLSNVRKTLMEQVRKIDEQIYDKQYRMSRPRQPTTETRLFQRPCPGEDCRGFLSGWKCGICGVKVCSKCHVIKSDQEGHEHECKDDDVATAKLLEKETKNCPNESCRAPIFKVEGCDQMWCTKCQTAFSWRTGEIVMNQSAIHNPHYYEWLRKQNNGVIPRNAGDVPCGGLPTIWTLNDTLRRKKIYVDINKYHRGVQHIVHYEIPRHPINLVGGEHFTNLRVKYLIKELSEDEWKKELQRMEKKNEKHVAFRHVFDMLSAVSVDMFNKILRANNEMEVRETLLELEGLRRYFNDSVCKIYKRFDSKSPKMMNDEWVFTTNVAVA
jgi:hypothetical protein